MTANSGVLLPRSGQPDPLNIVAAAFLCRYQANTRRTYAIVLRTYFGWCQQNGLDPLLAQRPHIELFTRHMEDAKYARTTKAKYVSAVCLFYKFAALDGYVPCDPAANVYHPKWPQDSTSLGLTHLQFEGMLHAAKESENQFDWALVVMLGMLGLRSMDATTSLIENLGEEHGHRVLRVLGKGGNMTNVPLPPAMTRAIDRAVGDRMTGAILLSSWGNPMNEQCQSRALKRIAKMAGVRTARMHPHMLRHTYVTTMLDAGVDLRDAQIGARHADPRTTMRYDRARNNLDRHGNYVLAAYMSGATD